MIYIITYLGENTVLDGPEMNINDLYDLFMQPLNNVFKDLKPFTPKDIMVELDSKWEFLESRYLESYKAENLTGAFVNHLIKDYNFKKIEYQEIEL